MWEIMWLTPVLTFVCTSSASPYGPDLKRWTRHRQSKFCFIFLLTWAGWVTTLRDLYLHFSRDYLNLMVIDKFRRNCKINGFGSPRLKYENIIYWWLEGVGCSCILCMNREPHICQQKWSQQLTHSREKQSQQLYIILFIQSLHLHAVLNVLHFFWVRGWRIHQGCSVLTLIVIAHFNAKTYCDGVFWNDRPSRESTVLKLTLWQHCEVGSNGIRALFPFSLKEMFAWTI